MLDDYLLSVVIELKELMKLGYTLQEAFNFYPSLKILDRIAVQIWLEKHIR